MEGWTMYAMRRREFLVLGAVAGGTALLGGWGRMGRLAARPKPLAVPTVDRLVMTNLMDNVYDVFARAGRVGNLTVQRTPLFATPRIMAEHGLAYHLESVRGDERKEVLLDFALTDRALTNNYQAVQIDPGTA